VARALMQVHGTATIEYMPMPQDLNSRYQHFTEADLTSLRKTGCDFEFTPLEEGVRETFAVQNEVLV
jgi:ADP-L-glycero-D-manno-heptose 6-epimerase